MTNKEDELRLWACVVKGKFENIADDCSSCGLLLYPQQGIILLHGSILAEPCLHSKSLFAKVKNGGVIKESDLPSSNFTVLVDIRWERHLSSGVQPSLAAQKSTDIGLDLQDTEQQQYLSLKSKFICAFRNHDFHDAVSRIMPDSNWTFTTNSEEDNAVVDHSSSKQDYEIDESDVCFNLLSYFLILKTESLNIVPQLHAVVPSLIHPVTPRYPYLKRSMCNIGDAAEIVATPFGSQNPSVFFNTYSRGIVCNVSGAHGCWIVTDARCIPGSEGGPLFTKRDNQPRYLSGIITASLCWKNKEWVGFSLACSIDSIRNAFESQLKRNRMKLSLDMERKWTRVSGFPSFMTNLEKSTTEMQYPYLSSTVLVRVGSTWGSGVIVDRDQGVILTCSHVVKHSTDFPVMIKPFQGSPEHRASVIYSHHSAMSRPFDLAVLKCKEATSGLPKRKVPKLCHSSVGQQVWAVGHALFSSDLDLHPSVCAGVISKVITWRGQPVMIQTTCAVHAGASGGPLLDEKGNLVGIMVCNTIDKGSNSCYPHMNMSVPAISIWPALQNFIKTGDTSDFATFELSDPHVRKVWALESNAFGEGECTIRSKL